jgi:hypothetical protein
VGSESDTGTSDRRGEELMSDDQCQCLLFGEPESNILSSPGALRGGIPISFGVGVMIEAFCSGA